MSHRGQSYLKTITRARPVSLKPQIQYLICIGTWGACTRRFFWRLNSTNANAWVSSDVFSSFKRYVVKLYFILSEKVKNMKQSSIVQNQSAWLMNIRILIKRLRSSFFRCRLNNRHERCRLLLKIVCLITSTFCLHHAHCGWLPRKWRQNPAYFFVWTLFFHC